MNSLPNQLFEFDVKICAGNDNDCNKLLIGVDEAGRGPGAGDVYAAAVCFKKNFIELISKDECELLAKLNDSKKLSPKLRENLADIIKKCTFYSIKSIEIKKIEEINILKASLLAMKLACEDVIYHIGIQEKLMFHTLVDGNKKIPDHKFEQTTLTKGDSKSAAIAAASILAKVARDFYMLKLHEKHPQYNWAKNKGYLTREHIKAIKTHGVTQFHRKNFLGKIL